MKRILLAYDGTEPARKALATAADLAKKYEASVTVVSVVPVHPGRAPMDPWMTRRSAAPNATQRRRASEARHRGRVDGAGR